MDKTKLKIDKEKELLTLILYGPEHANLIFETIAIDMISKENRGIFEAIKELKPIDEDNILWELNKHSLYEIINLKVSTDIGLHIKQFFEIYDSIRVDNLLRESLKESENCFSNPDVVMNLKNKLEIELEKYTRFERALTFNESLYSIIERIENRVHKSDSITTKNFFSFNTATGGLREGNLIGIAGAFKNGKTTFGMNLILDIAGQNIPSAIFSLEMSKSEIEEKILSYKAGITYEKIRNPQRLSDDEKLTINKFLTKNKSAEKLFLFDRKFTLSEIETTVKGLCNREKVKVILIDYLGLIKTTAKNIENREREISHLSNSLKILAKETETVIFVLSQLNRSGIKEASSINLAESIALARESDFLFTIYKPDVEKYKKITMDGREIPINESNFIVKLDSSRHTQSGKEFLLELSESGKMREIETRYDLSYLNSVSEPFEL